MTNTPPQAGGGEDKPSLHTASWCHGLDKTLVNTSTNWSCVETWEREIRPSCNFYLIKWQSKSMCLVLSWKTGLLAMYMAAWLSHFKGIGIRSSTSNSTSNLFNQANSKHTRLIDLYSASVDDKDTVVCFFDF